MFALSGNWSAWFERLDLINPPFWSSLPPQPPPPYTPECQRMEMCLGPYDNLNYWDILTVAPKFPWNVVQTFKESLSTILSDSLHLKTFVSFDGESPEALTWTHTYSPYRASPEDLQSSVQVWKLLQVCEIGLIVCHECLVNLNIMPVYTWMFVYFAVCYAVFWLVGLYPCITTAETMQYFFFWVSLYIFSLKCLIFKVQNQEC